MTLRALGFFVATLAAVGTATAAPDHHCQLPDGSFDGTKTEQQRGAAKGKWLQETVYSGMLKTDGAAIRGETTGTTLGENELDLHGDAALTKAATALDGKAAVATGYLVIKRGVEIAERHIIVVSSLKPAARN